MTVYAWGTEPWHFEVLAGSLGVETASSRRDTLYSRVACHTTGSTRVQLPLSTQVAECWARAVQYLNAGGSLVQTARPFVFVDADGVEMGGIRRRTTGTSGEYDLFTGPLASPTNTVALGQLQGTRRYVDMHFVQGENGSILLYFDGDIAASIVGDTRPSTGTGVAAIVFDGHSIAGGGGTNNFSQVIVSSTPTLSAHVHTVAPAALSADNDWVGTLSQISGWNTNIADVMTGLADGDDLLFTNNGLGTALLPDGEITAVRVSVRATHEVLSSITALAPLAVDGTVDVGTDIQLSSSWVDYHTDYLQDPNATAPWEPATLAATEFGYRARP